MRIFGVEQELPLVPEKKLRSIVLFCVLLVAGCLENTPPPLIIGTLPNETDSGATFYRTVTGNSPDLQKGCAGVKIFVNPNTPYPLPIRGATGIMTTIALSPTQQIEIRLLSLAGSEEFFSDPSIFPPQIGKLLESDHARFIETSRILTIVHELVHACYMSPVAADKVYANNLFIKLGLVPNYFSTMPAAVRRGFAIEIYSDQSLTKMTGSLFEDTEEAITDWLATQLIRRNPKFENYWTTLDQMPPFYKNASTLLNQIGDPEAVNKILGFKKQSDIPGLLDYLKKELEPLAKRELTNKGISSPSPSQIDDWIKNAVLMNLFINPQ